MAVTSQPSISSLSNYSILQEPNGAYGSPVSFNFCNSFWGEGDEGANVLFIRMRSAIKTTEDLQTFWTQRAAIEEEFGRRLATLARMPVGAEETGALKSSLRTLATETQRQAESHLELASNIRRDLIEPIARFHDKQVERKRSVQAPAEKKFKAKLSQASYVSKAREKYEGDIARIKTYRQQATEVQGQELDRLQTKLRRALETVKANEKDYVGFVRVLSDLSAEWEANWKGFCDNSQDLEEERLEFMKDNLWNYANMISTICVSDDESCEKIRTALDQLEPDRDLIEFVRTHGTGNRVTDPPTFVSIDFQKQSPTIPTPAVRAVHYDRLSDKPEPIYRNASTTTPQPTQSPVTSLAPSNPHSNGGLDDTEPQPNPQYERVTRRDPPVSLQSAPSQQSTSQQTTSLQPAAPQQTTAQQSHPGIPYGIPPPPPIPEEPPREMRRGQSIRRDSQPLPHPPGQTHVQQPPPTPQHPPVAVPVTETGNRILFLVKALYDYRATIGEEFDFQTGDIIAVTETPDDGWWSGELLDEARREPGRHIFPSNYVCLF